MTTSLCGVNKRRFSNLSSSVQTGTAGDLASLRLLISHFHLFLSSTPEIPARPPPTETERHLSPQKPLQAVTEHYVQGQHLAPGQISISAA